LLPLVLGNWGKGEGESLGKLIGAVTLGIIIENCRDQSAIALLKSLGIVNFQTTDIDFGDNRIVGTAGE
jgi:hypothetical protein